MRLKELPALLLCLALPLAVGAVSGIATASGLGTWYDGLAKPSFNPPSRVFGPVWTTLYALMGISLFLVRRAPASRERRRALIAPSHPQDDGLVHHSRTPDLMRVRRRGERQVKAICRAQGRDILASAGTGWP